MCVFAAAIAGVGGACLSPTKEWSPRYVKEEIKSHPVTRTLSFLWVGYTNSWTAEPDLNYKLKSNYGQDKACWAVGESAKTTVRNYA